MTELPTLASLTLPPPIWLPPMNPEGARFISPLPSPREIHRAWERADVAFCGLSVSGVPEWAISTAEEWEVNEVPFCDGCSAAAWAIQYSREKASPPPMVIIHRTVEQPVVLCPHCLRPGSIISEEQGRAYPKIEFYYGESIDPPAPGHEEILASLDKYDHDFDTVRYSCQSCDRSVSIPDDSVEFVYG